MQPLKEFRNTFSSSRTGKAQSTATLSKSVGFLIVFLSFAVVVIFVSLPLLALFAYGTLSGFLNSLSSPVVVEAIRLSVVTTLTTFWCPSI